MCAINFQPFPVMDIHMIIFFSLRRRLKAD